jgi:hypothetical protein
LARQAAERRKSLEEMKRNVSQMPPDMRESMEAAVKEAEANNAKPEKDPQMVAMMRQGLEAQRAEEQQAYKGRPCRRAGVAESRFLTPPRPGDLMCTFLHTTARRWPAAGGLREPAEEVGP